MNKQQKSVNPSKVLALSLASIILIGGILLSLPIATENGQGLAFIDALFTATSAACVTGLVVVDTGDTFTTFGEVVIMLLIQLGGLGFMTFATLLFMALGKRISLKEKLVLKEAFNTVSMEGVLRLAKRILVFTLIIEAIGATLLAWRFAEVMPLSQAIYYGIFHAISMFNNAGFDILGGFQSFTGYVDDAVIVLTICLLIIIGGLGFIVVNELYEYRQTKRLSVHSKIILSTTAILLIGSAILIFFFELQNAKTLQPLSPMGKVLGALFHSVTPRTAGANTLSMADLTHATLFLTIFLMFIGGGSGSTAGGIKISTFVVLIMTAVSQLKGQEDVTVFKKRIVTETVLKALTVVICSGLLVAFVTFVLSITDSGHVFIMYLFEATSAFGTVGLSLGLTPELSFIGKLVIITTMFIGRLGPLTLGFALTKKQQKKPFRYTKGNIMIG